jgi:hypothetical protein
MGSEREKTVERERSDDHIIDDHISDDRRTSEKIQQD